MKLFTKPDVIFRVAEGHSNTCLIRFLMEADDRMRLYYRCKDAAKEDQDAVRLQACREVFCLGAGDQVNPSFVTAFTTSPEFEEGLSRIEFETHGEHVLRHMYIAGMCSAVVVADLLSPSPSPTWRRKGQTAEKGKELFSTVASDILLGWDHSSYVAMMCMTEWSTRAH